MSVVRFSNKYLLVLLGSVMLLLPFNAKSQTDPSQQIWTDINTKAVINNKWQVYSDIGYRNELSGKWDRYLGRVSALYKPFVLKGNYDFFSNMEFHGGVGYFFTDYSSGTAYLGELRVIQGVRAYWPILKRVKFTHFIRVEERFEHSPNIDIEDFSMRFRYAISTKLRFKAPVLNLFYFPLSAEVFPKITKGLSFNDVVRLTAGIGYDINDQIKLDLDASWHKSKNETTGDLTNDIFVYRIRLHTVF